MKETSSGLYEKDGKQTQDMIIKILTDEKLSAFKTLLEKNHAIDCILLLMLEKGQWKRAKDFMRKLDLTISDGTYRARMLECEDNRIANHENIDAKKKRWIITNFGKQIGGLLLSFFSYVEDGTQDQLLED